MNVVYQSNMLVIKIFKDLIFFSHSVRLNVFFYGKFMNIFGRGLAANFSPFNWTEPFVTRFKFWKWWWKYPEAIAVSPVTLKLKWIVCKYIHPGPVSQPQTLTQKPRASSNHSLGQWPLTSLSWPGPASLHTLNQVRLLKPKKEGRKNTFSFSKRGAPVVTPRRCPGFLVMICVEEAADRAERSAAAAPIKGGALE